LKRIIQPIPFQDHMGATLALLSNFYNYFKLGSFCLFYYQNVMHALSMNKEMSADAPVCIP